jgi:hypothetical protein
MKGIKEILAKKVYSLKMKNNKRIINRGTFKNDTYLSL